MNSSSPRMDFSAPRTDFSGLFPSSTSSRRSRHGSSANRTLFTEECLVLGIPMEEDIFEDEEFDVFQTDEAIERSRSSVPLSLGASPDRRKRHFSLEDFNETFDEVSSSSGESFQVHQEHIDIKAILQKSFDPVPPMSLETLEPHISSQLLSEMETKLFSAVRAGNAENPGLGEIVLPNGFIQMVANHIVQEAVQEPCGIKGCVIYIRFDGESSCHHLGKIVCDPCTAPTFEVTLTLRQAPKSWIKVPVYFRSSPCVSQVSTAYKLVKRRLYREEDIILKE